MGYETIVLEEGRPVTTTRASGQACGRIFTIITFQMWHGTEMFEF